MYEHAKSGSASIQSDQDALRSGYTGVELWLAKIEHQKEEEKEWREIANEACEVYEAGEDKKSNFNIFHSNIETLVPSLYNSTPIPDVRRRYGDTDRVARLGAETIERGINVMLDQDGYGFDAVMNDVVQDGVLPGRGEARIRAEPVGEPNISVIDGKEVETYDEYAITCETVAWNKFIRGPALLWKDVPWVAFEHDLTEDDCRDQLGLDDELLEKLGFGDDKEKDGKEDKDDKAGVYKTIRAYEVWDKRSRDTEEAIVWVSKRHDEPLATFADPLGLKNFFPVPKPYQQIRRANSLVPRCQYKIYKPLLDELDEVSKRIRNLIKDLRVRAASDPSISATLSLLESAMDGEVVEAQGAVFSAGGKLADLVHHWPLEPTVRALSQLYQQREQLKAQIYEVTGISDIMRGQVDSREKLGQSEIKAKSLSVKLNKQQKEVQRFARDLFRMMAEAGINLIPWRTIKEATRMDYASTPAGINSAEQPQLSPEQRQNMAVQTEEAVRALLQSKFRTYSIDIESDSTIRADLSRNQDQMNLMLQGSAQFIQSIAAAKQHMPEYVPGFIKLYQTTFLRQFQFNKEAEDALEALAEVPTQQQEDPRVGQLTEVVQKLQQELQNRNFEMEKLDRTIASNEKMKQLEIDQRAKAEAAAEERDQNIYIMKLGVEKQREENESRRLDAEERDRAIDLQHKDRELRLREAEVGIKAIGVDNDHDNKREDRSARREEASQRQRESNGSGRRSRRTKGNGNAAASSAAA